MKKLKLTSLIIAISFMMTAFSGCGLIFGSSSAATPQIRELSRITGQYYDIDVDDVNAVLTINYGDVEVPTVYYHNPKNGYLSIYGNGEELEITKEDSISIRGLFFRIFKRFFYKNEVVDINIVLPKTESGLVNLSADIDKGSVTLEGVHANYVEVDISNGDFVANGCHIASCIVDIEKGDVVTYDCMGNNLSLEIEKGGINLSDNSFSVIEADVKKGSLHGSVCTDYLDVEITLGDIELDVYGIIPYDDYQLDGCSTIYADVKVGVMSLHVHAPGAGGDYRVNANAIIGNAQTGSYGNGNKYIDATSVIGFITITFYFNN